MMIQRSSLPSLYHVRLNLSGQIRSIQCYGMEGAVTKAYPLLSHCRLTLSGFAGQTEEGLNRWQYTLSVPIMLLGEKNAGCGSLLLFPELETPYCEEIMRFSSGISCDVELRVLSARPTAQEEYELCFDAKVCIYLSV